MTTETLLQQLATAQATLRVESFTGGIVGPSIPMLGPLKSGGTLIASTAPGCWGPMITPKFKGGHEVTRPVAIEGAEVGDALVLRIRRVEVTSLATASGVMQSLDGRFVGDPFVERVCPGCGALSPATHIEGIGQQAVHCDKCGAEASPFRMSHGYTIVFDAKTQVGVTVPKEVAELIAGDARKYASLPPASEQHSILSYAVADLPGLVAPMAPFVGNLGTTPSCDMPDSHNAGDFGAFLVGAPHEYGLTQAELDRHKTDGHMDVNTVRPGAILICPVKVPGGGVYIGDVHAQQGNGEIAGHTTDVSGEVELQVELLKGLSIDGPILLQRLDDLPPLARPVTPELKAKARELLARYGASALEENAPLTFIGSGPNLNDATTNGLNRAAKATGLSYDEVSNRATLTGSIEIARLPGVVRVTFLCPLTVLERMGIADLVREQYGL
ncbi:MAG: acetamidase/formamidase family protein [Gammaproteobacteria bacterium]|nr:acetamidase [Rhodocyclaceae bacterium]MBU3910361.1 acetamidase/formamidase family protein [Gammaproteobacteria bacterium]MBU3989491.1 acetamidase/formamidase family protein [Gammaproteobacteria bacterium]MBU4004842.1 acetamidase/formamidase family protein [Gammaproteobacteria bacterium]MBU4020435.1 acetamidase/formamidase family protein [Gammaproteobacteria bacterium]